MFLIYLYGILGAIFSTLVLTYVSIATMFGPFIAPVLVLLASMLLRPMITLQSRKAFEQALSIVQAIGSVGGMLGIAIGFTLPTVYFLSPETFAQLIVNPFSFSLLLGVTTIVAGMFGLWLGSLFFDSLSGKAHLKFPVSIMVHETIVAQDHASSGRLLLKGSLFSWITCMARDGMKLGSLAIPSVFSWFGLSKNMLILPSFFGAELMFSVMPMVWAIGFTAGLSIVLPLLVGALSKYCIVYPLNMHSLWLPSSLHLFAPLKAESFLTAFCSGLVLIELLQGIHKYPAIILNSMQTLWRQGFGDSCQKMQCMIQKMFIVPPDYHTNTLFRWYDRVEAPISIIASIALLWYFDFSILAILFTLIGTAAVAYNICYLSGKIGLVPFGRFTTFVMLPALFLFVMTPLQVTWLCLFATIAMAAASNFLFSAKIGSFQSIHQKLIHRYTLIGIITTALVAGFCFWLLCQHFDMGSAELFAQRGRSRALLINSFNFDLYVVACGMLYGYLLRFFKLSPTMVFGGLLMPNNLTIGLLIGAIINHVFYQGKTEHPFWSGMLAGDTLWEFFSIACKMIG